MSYQILRTEIESDMKSTQDRLNCLPCPADCFHCCTSVATMTRISGVEAEYMLIGLRQLDDATRKQIYDKAISIISILEDKGWTPESIAVDGGVAALNDLQGTKDCAECPILVDGKCAVYKHRPVICRAWGYPVVMYGELNCCEIALIYEDKSDFKPIYYPYYEQQCDELSNDVSIPHRLPNVYLVKYLIEKIAD